MKNFIIIFSCIVLSQLLIAQEIHQKKSPVYNVQNKIPYNVNAASDFPVLDPSLGDTIGITNYDFWGNVVFGKRIVYYNGPHIVTHIRPFDPNPNVRLVYIYVESGVYKHISLFPGPGATGFPKIDIKLTGSDIGTIGISDGMSRLAIFNDSTFSIKFTPGNLYQSFVFSGDNIFLLTKDERLSQGYIYKSTDGGDSFLIVDSTSSFPIYSILLSVEVDMFKSPNEQYIGILGTAEGDGQVYNGVPVSNADNVWLIYSTDAGTTWNGKSIGYDGLINSVQSYHTPNYAPLFENFGQVSGAVGDDGVFHVVANGYGLVFDDEIGSNHIGSAFPVLYWNSQSEEWISISNIAIDTIQSLGNLRPGNNIGQSYPQISIASEQGILNAMWTAPQIENNQLVVSDDGYFYTDLHHAYSFDNGEIWYNFYGSFASKSEVSETFAIQANHIRSDLTELYLDVIYLEDLSAGVFVFGEGDQTDNPIIYKTVLVPPAPLSVNDPEGMVENFVLYQNYPNPFNPSTLISFYLKEAGEVKLSVYNVIGQKIATLLDNKLSSGNHSVVFKASDLPSGIYYYQLQSDESIKTMKMMLLK